MKDGKMWWTAKNGCSFLHTFKLKLLLKKHGKALNRGS